MCGPASRPRPASPSGGHPRGHRPGVAQSGSAPRARSHDARRPAGRERRPHRPVCALELLEALVRPSDVDRRRKRSKQPSTEARDQLARSSTVRALPRASPRPCRRTFGRRRRAPTSREVASGGTPPPFPQQRRPRRVAAARAPESPLRRGHRCGPEGAEQRVDQRSPCASSVERGANRWFSISSRTTERTRRRARTCGVVLRPGGGASQPTSASTGRSLQGRRRRGGRRGRVGRAAAREPGRAVEQRRALDGRGGGGEGDLRLCSHPVGNACGGDEALEPRKALR